MGIVLARRRAAGDAKLLREVARVVVTRAVGNRLQRAIEHEALRVELKSARGKPAALAAVRDRIGRGWPGAEDTKNRAEPSLVTRYRADPVAVYNVADEDDRHRLHRVLYADLAIGLIIAEAREAGTSGYKVAELIRQRVPEASAEASRFERMAHDADLKRVAGMGRSELDRLVARLNTAQRATDADRAVDRWLEARRGRLLAEGVAGRLRLADLVLSLKNDRSAAVSMLVDADRLKPDDPEVAERLGQLGYAKQGKKWVQVRRDLPTVPRRVAAPTGVRVGMSGKQLLAAMGTPRRVNRLAAKRLISVREKEPPTGNAPESAAAMLATPWLTNSRSAFQMLRVCTAIARAMAAGSANPTSAMTRPGNMRCGISDHGKSNDGIGQAVGMAPTTVPG